MENVRVADRPPVNSVCANLQGCIDNHKYQLDKEEDLLAAMFTAISDLTLDVLDLDRYLVHHGNLQESDGQNVSPND